MAGILPEYLKMFKHEGWATIIASPNLIGSMNSKGQMKPIFRVSSAVSQPLSGRREQPSNAQNTTVYHCHALYIILTDKIFKT